MTKLSDSMEDGSYRSGKLEKEENEDAWSLGWLLATGRDINFESARRL